MKYLKLFEALDDLVIDKDYIEMCFVDFIDEDNFSLRVYGNGDSKIGYDITFDVKDSSYVWKQDSITYFKKRAEKRLDFFKKIEECLSKIRIKYPNMKYNVTDSSGSDYQRFKVNITESKDLMQFNPTGWF